jgi:hypothetical protein
VELELEMTISRSTKPGVKARLMVVDVQAGHERARAAKHRIKVVLDPGMRDDPDQQAWVGGGARDGGE